MAQNSKIEWCHHTANLWWGCTAVHSGCDHCYAETLSKRWGHKLWGNDVPRRAITSVWKDLIKFQRLAKEADEIHSVFVGSMMDIAEKPMPLIDSNGNVFGTTNGPRNVLFSGISTGKYPNLMFLFLTKRPGNIPKYIPVAWLENPPSNVMFGTSPVDQKTMLTLTTQLLLVKGKKFLSIEPQLGLINLKGVIQNNDNKPDIIYDFTDGIDWIIQGGESGHHKRPFNLEWARSMRDQCKQTGVPYFFKQIDKIQAIPEDLMIRQFPS